MRLFVLLSLLLLLNGCGGKTAPVRIATVGPGLQTLFLPVTLTEALGYFREEGVDVVRETLPSTGKALQALVAGSVDLAESTYFQAVQMAAEGRHLRSIVVETRRSSVAMIVAPAAMDKIRRIEDLRGQTVGVGAIGSTTNVWLNVLLVQHGLRPADVITVATGVGNSTLAALEGGQLAAGAMSGADAMRVRQRHPELRVLADGSTKQGSMEIYGAESIANTALMAQQDWLERNPDAARRLARAVRRTQAWLTSHTAEEVLAKLPASMRSADAAQDLLVMRAAMEGYTSDGRMPAGGPEIALRFMAAADEKVRNAKINLAATWTDAYLEAAK